MQTARRITIAAIVVAGMLWLVTIIGWIATEPGYEPANVFVAAIISTLAAVLGWQRTQSLDSEVPLKSSQGKLEITNVAFTSNAELDIRVRNLSDNAIIINRITIFILKDTGLEVHPVLQPTEYYRIPINDLGQRQSRTLEVSHYIDAHKADRFLVGLETIRALKIRVILHCNTDDAVSFTKTIWM